MFQKIKIYLCVIYVSKNNIIIFIVLVLVLIQYTLFTFVIYNYIISDLIL